MSAFPLPLLTDATGPKSILTSDFVFNSPSKGRIVVEKGFDTDYASVPRALWWLYPPWGDYKRAAVVHDWAYWWQHFTREEADTLFLEGMEALGIPRHRRFILHKAVRTWGWLAWADNQKKRGVAHA